MLGSFPRKAEQVRFIPPGGVRTLEYQGVAFPTGVEVLALTQFKWGSSLSHFSRHTQIRRRVCAKKQGNKVPGALHEEPN